jgi:hypothetical protein
MKIGSEAFFSCCVLDRKLVEHRVCLGVLEETKIPAPSGKRNQIFHKDCCLLGCDALYSCKNVRTLETILLSLSVTTDRLSTVRIDDADSCEDVCRYTPNYTASHTGRL